MSTVTVSQHESELGTWSSAEWSPAPGSLLAGAVDRVWYFDGALGTARERVFPDGTLELSSGRMRPDAARESAGAALSRHDESGRASGIRWWERRVRAGHSRITLRESAAPRPEQR